MILITGISGFIGKNIGEKLLTLNKRLRGLDIILPHEFGSAIEYIKGNILCNEVVIKSMEDIDCVIHLAAEHKDFGVKKEDYFKVNVEGTKILLEASAKFGVNKFIFFSSVAVYGNNSPSNEDTLPDPINFYGISKLEAEKEVIKWANEDKKRTAIIIRPTVVYGPGSKANIFRLIRQICDGKFIMVGNGNNIKSIAYVRNLVDATLFLMDKCNSGVHVFNYSDEPQLTTKQLVNLIAKIASRRLPSFYIPLKIAMSFGYGFDILGKITGKDFPITAARMKKFATSTCHQAYKIRKLGFVQKYSIEDGLREHIEWYLKNKENLDQIIDSSE